MHSQLINHEMMVYDKDYNEATNLFMDHGTLTNYG